jgi:hypothetical protein
VEESDDHLPRVQIELDKLNYANESINNLELELVESKKDFIRTWVESDEELGKLEKKLGACVSKSLPYYHTRIELNEAKDKYLKAKIRFETAQELYMAAKNMQMYAEETLEKDLRLHSMDSDEIKLLKLSKAKVHETEQAKKVSDLELVEALRCYEAKIDKMAVCEKELKKMVEKSVKYYELKASQLKELKFLFVKIEGLKSCLKEAKLTYQQSLKNLESISTEVHTQRKTGKMRNAEAAPIASADLSTTNFGSTSSSTTLSSSSSSSLITDLPLTDLIIQENNADETNPDSPLVETIKNESPAVSEKSEEDFDNYFLNKDAPPPSPSPPTTTTTTAIQDDSARMTAASNYFSHTNSLTSKSFNKKSTNKFSLFANTILLSDEDIENLKFDEKLKNYYKSEFDNNNNNNDNTRQKADVILVNSNDKSGLSQKVTVQPLSASQLLADDAVSSNTRPQFRVPNFFK